MKLFVWNNPYTVNYGGSCLYVIAENVEQARRLAIVDCADASFGGFDRTSMKKCKVDVIDQESTSVHELPYAECYAWEE